MTVGDWLRGVRRHPVVRKIDDSVDAALFRALEHLRLRAQRGRVARYRSLHDIHDDAQLLPECIIENYSKQTHAISIGARTAVRAELLVLGHGGRIQIGDWCYLGAGTRLWSACAIEVGSRVLVSHGVEVHDWNAHSLSASLRHQHFRHIVRAGHPFELPEVASAAVRIEDDVWIGFGSTVLKGVTIGRGSVVAARSLVTESVPPWTMVAGHPARPVRTLVAEEIAASE